jgi:septum site-determining protein MinC
MNRGDFLVSFRGTKSGLIILFDEESEPNEIINELKKKLEDSGYFFFGASVIIDSGTLVFSKKQLLEIRELLRDKHGLNIQSIRTNSALTEKNAVELNWEIVNQEDIEEEEEEKPEPHPPTPTHTQKKQDVPIQQTPRHQPKEKELPTKIFRQSLRSGQFLEYEGHAVILGDVNPGAEVIADGDIIIFGALRGMAFAGAKGRKESIILANRFTPTQIRIADKLARADENSDENPDIAEFAFIENDRIIIDVWKKNF